MAKENDIVNHATFGQGKARMRSAESRLHAAQRGVTLVSLQEYPRHFSSLRPLSKYPFTLAARRIFVSS